MQSVSVSVGSGARIGEGTLESNLKVGSRAAPHCTLPAGLLGPLCCLVGGPFGKEKGKEEGAGLTEGSKTTLPPPTASSG